MHHRMIIKYLLFLLSAQSRRLTGNLIPFFKPRRHKGANYQYLKRRLLMLSPEVTKSYRLKVSPSQHPPVSITLILTTLLQLSLSSQVHAIDYYWVGGSGDWSDLSHWARSSGGSERFIFTPSPGDNVIFDENSFPEAGAIVRLDVDAAFCKNFDWRATTNSPTFIGERQQSLQVFGNLWFSESMNNQFTGTISFRNPDQDVQINPQGESLASVVYFQGFGRWELLAPLLVDSIILLENGHLKTSGFDIQTNYLTIDIQENGSLDLGNSIVNLDGPFQVLPDEVGSRAYTLRVENMPGVFNLIPGQSSIQINHPEAEVYWAKSNLTLNTLIFTNPEGNPKFSAVLNTKPKINQLQHEGNTRFFGSLLVDQWQLSPGKTYKFENEAIYEIGSLEANGSCQAQISILGTNTENATTTFQVQSPFNGTSLNLLNMNFVGTANVMEGVDLGGNSGWNINTRSSQSFYWIGGTGEWTDLNHWSYNSGGPPAGCLPSIIDDVYFDENSFSGLNQSVTINTVSALCRDMNWSDNLLQPILQGNETRVLQINGDLRLSPSMQMNFTGQVYFAALEQEQTIETSGQVLPGRILFNSENGGWRLLGELEVKGSIQFDRGILSTNDQTLRASQFISTTDLPRTLELGASDFYLTNNDQSVIWNLRASNFNLDAGQSTIYFDGNLTTQILNTGEDLLNFHNIQSNGDDIRLFFFQLPVSIDTLRFQGNGQFRDNVTIDVLELTAGGHYDFVTNKTVRVRQVTAKGNCENGLVTLRSAGQGRPAFMEVGENQEWQWVAISGIEEKGPGQVTVRNGVDMGFNQGFQFEELVGRTLYWVGDSGNWEDASHWSLSSGGPGGACIPNFKDDIIFDKNSFTSTDATIASNVEIEAFCRHMTWQNINTQQVELKDFHLNLHGNLQSQTGVLFNVLDLSLRGEGRLFVDLAGEPLAHGISLDAPRGVYELRSDYSAQEYLYLFQGHFYTLDHKVEAGMLFVGDFMSTLGFGKSHFVLNDVFPAYTLSLGDNQDMLEVEGQDFTIEFTGQRVRARVITSKRFGHLIFSHPNGEAQLISNNTYYRKLSFLGNADLHASDSRMDSLIMSPGKRYELESGRTQSINRYWEIKGNACTPIQLSASRPSTNAIVSVVNSVELIADHVNIEAITGVGGNAFIAGGNSKNVNNSSIGWQFEEDDTAGGFLGADQILCGTDSIFLTAGPDTIGYLYQWEDGSNSSSRTIDQAGAYAVTVTYPEGCALFDEVSISSLETLQSTLPRDTFLCNDEPIILDASLNQASIEYFWDDQSTSSQRAIDQAGQYTLEIRQNSCVSFDTISVEERQAFIAIQASDTVACEGEIVQLTYDNADLSDPIWSTGATNQTIKVTTPGIYRINGEINRCLVEASISIQYGSPDSLDLGPDTLFACLKEPPLLNPGLAGTYLWQDGSTMAQYQVMQSGLYQVEIDNGICLLSDQIQIFLEDCEQVDIYFPTAFSPNFDGINDEWIPGFSEAYEILDYGLEVYDRWGGKVFFTNNPQIKWDGRKSGDPLSRGVYYFQLKMMISDRFGNRIVERNGEINLLF